MNRQSLNRRSLLPTPPQSSNANTTPSNPANASTSSSVSVAPVASSNSSTATIETRETRETKETTANKRLSLGRGGVGAKGNSSPSPTRNPRHSLPNPSPSTPVLLNGNNNNNNNKNETNTPTATPPPSSSNNHLASPPPSSEANQTSTPSSPPRPLPPIPPSHPQKGTAGGGVGGGGGGGEQSLIKVCVRVRPFLSEENGEPAVWQWKENQISPNLSSLASSTSSYSLANPNATFSFDQVFTPSDTNSDIFTRLVKDVVSAGMQGYHGSVFTYGQTSSGKTFTMYGTPQQNGVIAQAIGFCFDAINAFPEREFLLRVSYLEVYNETVKDLLNSESGGAVPIRILYDPKVGTVLSGVKEHVVFNPQQVFQLIKAGEQHRHVGVTDMNTKSSRAHTLFKLIIESKERGSQKSSAVRVSTLNLVDLAGSENAKMTNSVGERAREAKHINQSLLTLSTIIQRLSEDQSNHSNNNNNNNATNNSGGTKRASQHLPYRDSKLTRLLESALDGNARIAIICNISPTLRCLEESVNTLKFGARAKLIRIYAKVNENVDEKTLLRAYREEIEQLKQRLKELEDKQIPATNLSFPSAYPPISSSTTNSPGGDVDGNNAAFAIDNSDNNSIEVSSNNEIQETILQIEDKILHSKPHLREEDEQHKMLQMIEAMERLILKADGNNKNKMNRRTSFNVSSAETIDPQDRGLKLKASRSNDPGLDVEAAAEYRKSFRKTQSFATGIPIMPTGNKSHIPRRGAPNCFSRSTSNDNRSLDESVEKVTSGELGLTPLPSPSQRGNGIISPKGSLKRKDNNFFSKGSWTGSTSRVSSEPPTPKDSAPPTVPAISSQSFEKLILAAEQEKNNNSQTVEENAKEDGEVSKDPDDDERFKPLKRHISIPLEDLHQNFTKLENTAERMGIYHHHAPGVKGGMEHSISRSLSDQDKDIRSFSKEFIDRNASISPLTMYTYHTTPAQNDTKTQYHPMEGSAPLIGIAEAAENGIAMEESTMKNEDKQPSPFLASPKGESSNLNTPMMKNRIRKVKYFDENEPEAATLEKMRQMALSNDTFDSFQSSIDPRYIAPNEVQIEDDSVLIGVSKMLMMLKDYIAKPKSE